MEEKEILIEKEIDVSSNTNFQNEVPSQKDKENFVEANIFSYRSPYSFVITKEYSKDFQLTQEHIDGFRSKTILLNVDSVAWRY